MPYWMHGYNQGHWPHGWQHHATRTRNLYYRDRVLLPALQPASRALLRSQGGPRGGAWLAAAPGEPALTLAPQAMQLERDDCACPSPCAPTADRDRVAARLHEGRALIGNAARKETADLASGAMIQFVWVEGWSLPAKHQCLLQQHP